MKPNPKADQQHLVMMRKFRDNGDVIALFVEEPADTSSPYNCMSYMIVGQHASAHPLRIMEKTRRAAPGEYMPLLKELERVGYGQNVKVIDRMTKKMQKTREANWRRMTDPKSQPRYKLEALLREYVECGETNQQGGLRDLLTDLRHIADREDLNFDFAVDGSAAVQEEENDDKVLLLSVKVPSANADDMRNHLERMATQDVRVSPVEYARRHGFNISATVR